MPPSRRDLPDGATRRREWQGEDSANSRNSMREENEIGAKSGGGFAPLLSMAKGCPIQGSPQSETAEADSENHVAGRQRNFNPYPSGKNVQ